MYTLSFAVISNVYILNKTKLLSTTLLSGFESSPGALKSTE